MKILIITSCKIPKPKIDADVTIKAWQNTNDLNLIDYDGIIFDVDSLTYARREKDDFYLHDLEKQISPQLFEDILENKQSFIWIIGDPTTQIYLNNIAVNMGFIIERIDKGGTNIIKAKKNDKYYDYWHQIKGYDYYLDKNIRLNSSMDSFLRTHQSHKLSGNDKLTTKSGYIVGISLTMKINGFPCGDFIFAPLIDHNSEKSIDTILKIYFNESENAEPDWAKSIVAIDQQEIETKIKKNQDEIDGLVAKGRDLQNDLANARLPVSILYKNGKSLESAIKESLKQIDINIVEPEKENEEEFYIEQNNLLFVAEVKSTEKPTFNKKGLRQAQEWSANALAETGKEYKPIFITSNQFNIEPSQRKPDPIEENLQKFAEKYSIAIIQVTDLYDLLQQVKSKKLTAQEFLEKIHNTVGMFEG